MPGQLWGQIGGRLCHDRRLTDKMLRGAPPGDTPAEQPTRLELVISQRVARAIGIDIPAAILDGADEVIE